MRLDLAACLFMLPLIAACATEQAVYDEAPSQYQQVSVMTPGQVGAHCFLQAGMRSYTTQTPGTVTIFRTSDPMVVTCFKGDHMTGSQTVKPMVAKVEENEADGDCISCIYPGTITVAMGLTPSSFERNLTQMGGY